jgi:hypothetical protein
LEYWIIHLVSMPLYSSHSSRTCVTTGKNYLAMTLALWVLPR